MVTTGPPKTIVKPTALGPVANTDTKLLIYGLFQKGRVLAQDAVDFDANFLPSLLVLQQSNVFTESEIRDSLDLSAILPPCPSPSCAKTRPF